VGPPLDEARQGVNAGQEAGLEHGLAGWGFNAQQHVVVVVAEAGRVLLVVVQVRVTGGVEVVEIVVEPQLGHEKQRQPRHQGQGEQHTVTEFSKWHRKYYQAPAWRNVARAEAHRGNKERA
jgi:hypothetical protein